MNKKFALIGAAGFVAPRHINNMSNHQLIKSTTYQTINASIK